MIHSAKDSEIVWVYSMGKRFQVRAITTTVDEANKFMEQHTETALIACFGEFNIIANQYAGVKDTITPLRDINKELNALPWEPLLGVR